MKRIIGLMTPYGEITSRKINGYYMVKQGPGRERRVKAEDMMIERIGELIERRDSDHPRSKKLVKGECGYL